MPVYNAEAYVVQAIQSILNQSFVDFELIIADDGSTDDSKKIIDSFNDPRLRRVHNNTNLGKTGTINHLFPLARGKFCSIHDADDYSEVDRFECQIDFMESNDVGICGTSFRTILENGDFFSETKMNFTNDSIERDIQNQSQFHGPTTVFLKELADNLDGIYRTYFNNNFEDIDLCYRILSQTKGANLGESLYNYRILPNSLCRKEVTVKNRNLYKVVYHLFDQRKNGKDDLELNLEGKVDDFFQGITSHYFKDTSLIYREAASYYMYYKLYGSAVKSSWKAFFKNPLELINLRTLLYCIRKSI